MNNKKLTYSSPESVCLALTPEQSVLQTSNFGTNEGFTDFPIEFELE